MKSIIPFSSPSPPTINAKSLQQLARANTDQVVRLRQNALAYAAVLGMSDDLDLHGQQYPFLGSIFYFGYLLMEFPTAWMLTHLPIGKYVSTLLILWGVCNCMMAACTSFAGAAVVRFFLGMLEAGILPACIVITAGWYRREEQPLRAALWYGPFSGVSESWPKI
ncbi:hypothetical protein MMC31_004880 [Peltigera leucophlebia]|nr:hypothetical protein [Peltigera leucophlebia]